MSETAPQSGEIPVPDDPQGYARLHEELIHPTEDSQEPEQDQSEQ